MDEEGGARVNALDQSRELSADMRVVTLFSYTYDVR
jgi:hypothetical protein